MNDIQIQRHADAQALAVSAARALVQFICQRQRTQNEVRLVLTGGGVGIETLRHVAALDHAAQQQEESFPIERVDWARVLIFFGDERFLPVGDEERNDTQARAALLDHCPIPADNIFFCPAPEADEDPAGEALDRAAEEYAKIIAEHAPEGFDLHLLGMGPDGHINSLFPEHEALYAQGTVVAVRNSPKPPAQRVSLTFSAIHSAEQVWILAAGAAKKDAVTQAWSGGNITAYPVAGAVGREETILWVDEESAPADYEPAEN